MVVKSMGRSESDAGLGRIEEAAVAEAVVVDDEVA